MNYGITVINSGASLLNCHSTIASAHSPPAAPALDRYGDFATLLGISAAHEEAWQKLRGAEASGRPLGSDAWLRRLETKTGRALVKCKPGPKPREGGDELSKLAP